VRNEATGLEYNGHSLNTLFAQRTNVLRPSFHRMIRDILRFNREAPESLRSGQADMSLGEYLSRGKYGREFVEQYIVPMGAAIWSTDPLRMKSFPARFFIRFFEHHGLLSLKDRPQWYVIDGGSREYVSRLTGEFAHRIRLSTPVEKIRRLPGFVEVTPRNGLPERFDAVFLATHSDQALAMLDDASSAEKAVLGAIQYQENEAVLHTDQRILPRKRLAWAAWNYHLTNSLEDSVAVTYNMNILQHIDAPVQFCVTLNNSSDVRARTVINRVTYHHPVYTAESIGAQQRQREINGANRTYFCGAYWRNGFHEDGVVSALSALEHFNEDQHAQLHLRRAS
jgi:predicted NAD/FAD-binding protein